MWTTLASLLALSLAGVLSTTTAQAPTLTVATPDPAQVVDGQQVDLEWYGGTRPFEVRIVRAGNHSETLVALHGRFWSPRARWDIDLAPGTSISVGVNDSTGQLTYSSSVLVLDRAWAPGTNQTASSVASASASGFITRTGPSLASQPAANAQNGDGGLSAGSIGAIIGSLIAALLALGALLAVILCRRRQSKRSAKWRSWAELKDDAQPSDVLALSPITATSSSPGHLSSASAFETPIHDAFAGVAHPPSVATTTPGARPT